jgi:hypothetical protein
MLLNVLHNLLRDQVSNRHVSPTEESDLGRADVVLHELLNDPNVVLPLLQSCQCFIDVCAASLGDC